MDSLVNQLAGTSSAAAPGSGLAGSQAHQLSTYRKRAIANQSSALAIRPPSQQHPPHSSPNAGQAHSKPLVSAGSLQLMFAPQSQAAPILPTLPSHCYNRLANKTLPLCAASSNNSELFACGATKLGLCQAGGLISATPEQPAGSCGLAFESSAASLLRTARLGPQDWSRRHANSLFPVVESQHASAGALSLSQYRSSLKCRSATSPLSEEGNLKASQSFEYPSEHSDNSSNKGRAQVFLGDDCDGEEEEEEEEEVIIDVENDVPAQRRTHSRQQLLPAPNSSNRHVRHASQAQPIDLESSMNRLHSGRQQPEGNLHLVTQFASSFAQYKPTNPGASMLLDQTSKLSKWTRDTGKASQLNLGYTPLTNFDSTTGLASLTSAHLPQLTLLSSSHKTPKISNDGNELSQANIYLSRINSSASNLAPVSGSASALAAGLLNNPNGNAHQLYHSLHNSLFASFLSQLNDVGSIEAQQALVNYLLLMEKNDLRVADSGIYTSGSAPQVHQTSASATGAPNVTTIRQDRQQQPPPSRRDTSSSSSSPSSRATTSASLSSLFLPAGGDPASERRPRHGAPPALSTLCSQTARIGAPGTAPTPLPLPATHGLTVHRLTVDHQKPLDAPAREQSAALSARVDSLRPDSGESPSDAEMARPAIHGDSSRSMMGKTDEDADADRTHQQTDATACHLKKSPTKIWRNFDTNSCSSNASTCASETRDGQLDNPRDETQSAASENMSNTNFKDIQSLISASCPTIDENCT